MRKEREREGLGQEEVEGALKRELQEAGQRLDAVFANAGVLFMGPHETITPAQKQQVFEGNARRVFPRLDAALKAKGN